MKQYTTIKVGYTAGIYGCSNEFFTTIVLTDAGMQSFSFKGLYGAEERVARALNEKGFRQIHTPSDYGRMKAREVNPHVFQYENQILEHIKNTF